MTYIPFNEAHVDKRTGYIRMLHDDQAREDEMPEMIYDRESGMIRESNRLTQEEEDGMENYYENKYF